MHSETHDCDVLILGAGLAGLSLARQLLLADPELRILLLERRHQVPRREQKVGEATVQASGYYYSRVLEMEEHLLRHFADLFSGWSIYSSSEATADRPGGVRYRTEAGEIDFLCQDAEGNFMVIELKRGKAPDRVVAQVDRYMEWVDRNLARPDQRVRGLIVAGSADQRLLHTLARRKDVDLYLYDWRLKLER